MNTRRDNISPLDSRYASKLEQVRKIFCEEHLVRVRIGIEQDWLLFLINNTVLPVERYGGRLLPLSNNTEMNDAVQKISIQDKDSSCYNVSQIEEIEEKTRHDIAALVQYLKLKYQIAGVNAGIAEFVHFGLTSQDIMTTGYNIVVKDYLTSRFNAAIGMLTDNLQKEKFDVIFLGRTHGQPAIPTSFKKEFNSYVDRVNINHANLNRHLEHMSTKFGGAINNFAVAKFANNSIDWEVVLDNFVKNRFDMERSKYGTQTDNYESLCMIFDSLAAISDILTDLCRDIWMYCMSGYLRLKYPDDHIGSSTMAQKINPIDFENAEGNLETAVMWCKFLSSRLRKSRLQRDLSDSTIMRNIGIPFAHIDLAIQGIIKGIQKTYIDADTVQSELDNNYQVLAEAVQTKLKYAGIQGAFDKVKHLFKGKKLDQVAYISIIKELGVGKQVFDELVELTPTKYFY